jgi:hypothetical protein
MTAQKDHQEINQHPAHAVSERLDRCTPVAGLRIVERRGAGSLRRHDL